MKMMTDKTIITLSAVEHQLVCNTGWILTKHTIVNKVIELLGHLLIPMQAETSTYKSSLPVEIFLKDPKISKGENYQLLPYIILDYPRYFSVENTVSIRTMFWWGNFFSVSLLLSGTIKDRFVSTIIENFALLQQKDFWVCINESPWLHHYAEDNFVEISAITLADFKILLTGKVFIKLSRKINLQHWNIITLFIEETFQDLINLLKISYLNDEKDL